MAVVPGTPDFFRYCVMRNLSLRRPVPSVCLWILLLVSWSAQAFGGVSFENVYSDEAQVANSNFAVIVASIEQVDDQGASNGDPPIVTLLVSEVLRGNVRPGRLHARWLPLPHDIDYVGGDAEARLREWSARPLAGPKLGLKMILIGTMGNGNFSGAKYVDSTQAFLVSARCRFTYSDEKREWALAAIKRGAEAAKREQEEQQKQQKAIEDKRRQWKEEIGVEEIVRLAKEADLVAVGRIVSGGVGSTPTFKVNVLKGVKRHSYTGNNYFVTVDLPDRFHTIIDQNGPDVLLLLKEHGMKLMGSSWYYPILENGVVYAGEESLTAVKDALLNEPGTTNTKPFCFIHISGYAFKHSSDDNRLMERQLVDAFRTVGEGRCTIAEGYLYTSALSTAEIGRRLLNAIAGIQISIDAKLVENPKGDDTVFVVSGLVPRGNVLEVVEENQIWPTKMGAEAMRDKADEFLGRLLKRAKP